MLRQTGFGERAEGPDSGCIVGQPETDGYVWSLCIETRNKVTNYPCFLPNFRRFSLAVKMQTNAFQQAGDNRRLWVKVG